MVCVDWLQKTRSQFLSETLGFSLLLSAGLCLSVSVVVTVLLFSTLQAVCCSDKVHCCPEGSTCNVTKEKTQCEKKGVHFSAAFQARRRYPGVAPSIPWYTKVPGTPVVSSSAERSQPGSPNTSSSAESHPDPTQPKDTTLRFKPLDKNHENSIDKHSSDFSTALKFQPQQHSDTELTSGGDKTKVGQDGGRGGSSAERKETKEDDVICPGGRYECPDGMTCCKMAQGLWGCCPLPHGVCCSDGEHCCPQGHTCEGATCRKDGVSQPIEFIELVANERPRR